MKKFSCRLASAGGYFSDMGYFQNICICYFSTSSFEPQNWQLDLIIIAKKFPLDEPVLKKSHFLISEIRAGILSCILWCTNIVKF